MDIAHEDQGGRGRFTVGTGAEEAELTYSPSADGSLVFDHTYVPEAQRGRGVAERLVDRAVAYARERGVRVVPACPYVASLFQRHPDRYGDVDARIARAAD